MKATARRTQASLGAVLALVLAAGMIFASSVGAQDEGNGFDVFSGRVTFQRYCSSCHGPEAKGDGNIAQYLKVQPADLTELNSKYGEFPVEQIHKYIDGRVVVRGHGTREMPVWGEVFQSSLAEPATTAEAGEERAERIIDQLVTYLQSIQVE